MVLPATGLRGFAPQLKAGVSRLEGSFAMENLSDHPTSNITRWISSAILVLSIVGLFVVRIPDEDLRDRGYGLLALAILLVVASALLLVDKWWGYLLASIATAPMFLFFCNAALKVHGVLPSSSEERGFLRDPASWRQFLISDKPEVFLHYILCTVVLAIGLIRLFQSVRWKRAAISPGG